MHMLFRALDYLIGFIQIAIFARVFISWIPVQKNHPLIRLLYQFTEPILGPIRAIFERSSGGRNMMLDFSPLVALLLLQVLRYVIPY